MLVCLCDLHALSISTNLNKFVHCNTLIFVRVYANWVSLTDRIWKSEAMWRPSDDVQFWSLPYGGKATKSDNRSAIFDKLKHLQTSHRQLETKGSLFRLSFVQWQLCKFLPFKRFPPCEAPHKWPWSVCKLGKVQKNVHCQAWSFSISSAQSRQLSPHISHIYRGIQRAKLEIRFPIMRRSNIWWNLIIICSPIV